MPPEKLIAEMAAYHEELQKAGAPLDASGLQASSKGWRVKYSGGKRSVIDGPRVQSKDDREQAPAPVLMEYFAA